MHKRSFGWITLKIHKKIKYLKVPTYDIGLDTARGKLLKHQGGRCAHCQLFFAVDDKTEVHHEDGNRKNNRLNNLKLLHLVCHDQVHRHRSTEECAHAKSDITEEPCARKLASTVLETSREG